MKTSKSRTSPKQPLLFDFSPAEQAEAKGGLVRINREKRALSPQQRSFNRLSGQIVKARAKLQHWKDEGPRLLDRVTAELVPTSARVIAARREMVLFLDRLVRTPPKGLSLSKRQRRALIELLCSSAQMLLDSEPDPELEAIHDHHAEVSYRKQLDEELAFNMDMTKDVLTGIFGAEMVSGHDAETPEQLFSHIQAQLAEQQRQQEAARAAGARTSGKQRRGNSRAERMQQEAQAASQSVRDVYRKLASSLHPDRETDPDERARKTEQMQQLNQAYQANDLLHLLSMQIDMEHIDQQALADLPSERLRHYNRVLQEQVHALEMEIYERIEALLWVIDRDVNYRIRQSSDIDRLIDARLETLNDLIVGTERVSVALSDPATRKQELADIVDAMEQDDEGDPFF